jgi:RNA 2',3'-cyclic 3'-phosphodiesterase
LGTVPDVDIGPHFGVRLFVAVDLPPEVADKVAALERPELRTIRWTTPEQCHVTVRFLGEVGEGLVGGSEGLAAALDTVPGLLGERGVGPVEAVLGPVVGWFPGRHVLQVPVDGLEQVAEVVALTTASWGEPPERSFRGHLTLARTRGQARGPSNLAGASIAARWPVSEIVLYSSMTGPEGTRYQAIHRVALPG